MKKLLFVLVAVLVLTFSMCYAASVFSDVNGTKYEAAVTKLSSLGIVNGMGNGLFMPYESVTRAQVSKMLVEGLGLKKANNNALTQFSDVNSSNWFYDYVKIAVDNGVIKGYTDGTFKPNDNVKFSELFTMIIRAMNKENQVSNTADWPAAYIQFAQNYGLLSNIYYSNVSDAANRGDVSIAIYNMINQLEAEKAPKENKITTKYGFIDDVTKSTVTTGSKKYTVASKSDDFTTDTYAVFTHSSLTDEITLVKSYGVKDLDSKAKIVDAVSGRKTNQEIRYTTSSKYNSYDSSKYDKYHVCVIKVTVNSKDALEVKSYSEKTYITDYAFVVGDRVIEDSTNEMFVVFTGLDVDDEVYKGKVQDTTKYATITYKWDGDHPSKAKLPSTEDVEIGTKYHVKYPQLSGYEFYVTNLSTESFVVSKDVTIKIGTVDFSDDDSGSAGSNIPLVDNFEKIEYTVRHICPGRLIDLNDYFMSINITDIDNVKAINDSKVKVTVTFDAYLNDDCSSEEAEYLRTDGYYEGADHVLRELTEAFILTDDGSDTCTVSFTQKNY